MIQLLKQREQLMEDTIVLYRHNMGKEMKNLPMR